MSAGDSVPKGGPAGRDWGECWGFVGFRSSPLRGERVPDGGGRVRGLFPPEKPSRSPRSGRFTHLAKKSFRVLQHQPVGKTQHADAQASEVGILGTVSLHPTRLRVHASVKLDGEARFAAVEIHQVVVNRVLSAEFQAEASVPQQVPSGSFGFRLATAELPNSLGWDAHCSVTPHPSRNAGHPLPKGEGYFDYFTPPRIVGPRSRQARRLLEFCR
jgi:hypothetical protein